MNDAHDPGPARESQSDARLRRDAALQRVRHMRRWVIGSSAALTAGFAVLVAEVAHGRSSTATPRTSSAASQSARTEPALPAVASPGDLGLQGPSQAPQSSPSQAQPAPSPSPSPSAAPSASSGGGGVVSGGS